MAILRILQYPDSRLRCKGRLVTDVKSVSIQRIIDDMIETLSNTKNCFGLSATQLDIIDAPKIMVVYDPEDKILCLINPTIIAATGKKSGSEGCMSIYPESLDAVVARAAKVTVQAIDRKGKSLEIVADDFFAKGLQHEIDHLDGILYIDRLSQLRRTLCERKLAKLQRR